MNKLGLYYRLTKPGIVRGNAIHVLAGALLASISGVDIPTIIAVLVGTSFVIASACVANNYLDRGIDAKMERTRRRASVTGQVPLSHAMVFAAVLLAIGYAVLLTYTNIIVAIIGAVAYIFYVFIYGYAKRKSTISTVVGAVPGALPAMAGYVAVDGTLSLEAWLVFFLIFAWQMPHFYAISLFRKKEYTAAGLPVLGVIKPFEIVKKHILGYMVLYLACIALLIFYKVVGIPSAILLLSGAAYWFFVYFRSNSGNPEKWSKSVFGASLVLTLVLLLASVLNVFVPPLQYDTMDEITQGKI